MVRNARQIEPATGEPTIEKRAVRLRVEEKTESRGEDRELTDFVIATEGPITRILGSNWMSALGRRADG